MLRVSASSINLPLGHLVCRHETLKASVAAARGTDPEVIRRGRNFFQTLQIRPPHEDDRAFVSGGLIRPPAVTGSAGKMVKGWKDCEKHNPSERFAAGTSA